MVSRKRQIKKRIDGITKAIEEHEEKLKKVGKNYGLREYYEKEINSLKKAKECLVQKLED